jgi:hypothetical protein
MLRFDPPIGGLEPLQNSDSGLTTLEAKTFLFTRCMVVNRKNQFFLPASVSAESGRDFERIIPNYYPFISKFEDIEDEIQDTSVAGIGSLAEQIPEILQNFKTGILLSGKFQGLSQ